jgi:hypothetical protein
MVGLEMLPPGKLDPVAMQMAEYVNTIEDIGHYNRRK